jgi:hypothetical protein
MHKREIIWNLVFAALLVSFLVMDWTGLTAFPHEYAAGFTRFVLVAVFVTVSLSIRSIMLALAEEKIILNIALFAVYWASMCQWIVVI